MSTSSRPVTSPFSLGLTLAVASLVSVACVAGIFLPSIYARDQSVVRSALVAQDALNLLLVVPLLLRSALRSRIQVDDRRMPLVWLGVLTHLLYGYAVYAFNVHHNALFLVYVALLSLCSYGVLTGALALTEDEQLVMRQPESARIARWTGVFLIVVGSLFMMMWLADLGSSFLANRVPAITVRYAVPTFAPYVLDLAFALPALIINGVRLMRQQDNGFVGGGLMLVSTTLMMVQLATGTLY